MPQKIILVHGFCKNYRDMRVLKNNLEKTGYEVLPVNLPLTFAELEYSTVVFAGKMESILHRLKPGEQVHLVGHSTGGLVIRKYLSRARDTGKISRCVLIAAPNRGSELADLLARFPIFINIFKTVGSLQTEIVKKLTPEGTNGIETGAIAGNKRGLLDRLLPGENDGRVTVDSVWYEGLQDFTVLPYGHKEIHYRMETAELTGRFLATGAFRNTCNLKL